MIRRRRSSEPGFARTRFVRAMTVNFGLWQPIGFGCIVLFVLTLGNSSVQTIVVEAGAQRPPSADSCYIPEQNPVRLHIREGEKAWTTCANGQVWVLIARLPEAVQDDPGRRGRRRPGDNASAIIVSGVQAEGDNSAASAVWPIEPAHNACQAVAPQPPNARASAVATDSANSSAGGPALGLLSPIEIGPSVPANPPMVATVIGVLREATACASAGDLIRLSALYTDEAAPRAAARKFAPFVQEPHAEPLPSGATPATPGPARPDPIVTPQPSLNDEPAQTFTVSQLGQLPLGYITAVLSRSDPNGAEQQYTIVLAFTDGQLLIADVIEGSDLATPAP